MKIGICKLCLLTKSLLLSHLMPAGLYPYFKHEQVSPLRIGDGVVFPTDQQTKDYLLCTDCEDILNKGGEAWMIPKFATIEYSFPFFTMLTNDPPALQDDGGAIYDAATNPLIDVQKVTHFAMGIFWRASVHSWKKGRVEPMIDLGPYSEAIRTWLSGETEFPQYMYLSVSVCRPPRAQVNMTPPTEEDRRDWHTFSMYILGVLFVLSVGRRTDAVIKRVSFFPAPGSPVMVSDDVTAHLNQIFGESYREARKT